MIQELLGTPTLIGGERKILPFNGGIILEGTPNPPLHPNLPSPWALPSSVTAVSGNGIGAVADAPPLAKNHSTNPSNSCSESNNNSNLRCPRCDSSNTKFCYYNNYNLTQPRHFCKTCRRYWTKGGALRNVPIGGGCRKNKPSATPSSAAISGTSSKSGGSKFKTLVSEPGRPGLVPGFDHETILPPPPIPVFWATGPHNSHILSLLKGSQSPSPNYGDPLPATAFLPFKEDANLLGSYPIPEPTISAHSGVNERSLGIDPLVHHLNYHQQQQNCAVIGGEISISGVQSLFQKLGAPTGNNYYAESNSNSISPGIHCNTVCTDTQLSSWPILESVPATATSELGHWNSDFCMSDLPTTNGAYP